MTTKTERLLIELGRQGHPLGRAIQAKEVPELIEALRQRLGVTEKELDLSPESLKRLEARLIAFHQAIESGQVPASDEDIVRLIREVAAYLGQVLVVNLQGRWAEPRNILWANDVIVPLPVETIKGREIRTSPDRALPVGVYAAYFWDLIRIGEGKGFLWKTYKMMTKKRWRETTKGLKEAIALQERLSK